MANFDDGVAAYVYASATVHVAFPIDFKGNKDISCRQCKFFRSTSRTCALNDEVCAYPDKYVGQSCPLKEIELNAELQ